jgi:hypothetical protein
MVLMKKTFSSVILEPCRTYLYAYVWSAYAEYLLYPPMHLHTG